MIEGLARLADGKHEIAPREARGITTVRSAQAHPPWLACAHGVREVQRIARARDGLDRYRDGPTASGRDDGADRVRRAALGLYLGGTKEDEWPPKVGLGGQ